MSPAIYQLIYRADGKANASASVVSGNIVDVAILSDNFHACAYCDATTPLGSSLEGWRLDQVGRLACPACVARLTPAPEASSEVPAAA